MTSSDKKNIVTMETLERCLMGMEDAVFCRRFRVPSFDAAYTIAEYIYDKPALSIHADGFLECFLDCFSIDVVATGRSASGMDVMDVVDMDPEDAILVYDVADVLIAQRCPQLHEAINLFKGNHIIYIYRF